MDNKDIEMQKETNIWYAFYTTFNDSNIEHADNAFLNQGFKTAEEIHQSNVEWARELMSKDVSVHVIVQLIPYSTDYIAEALVQTFNT